jgi:hypothetical protein
MKDESTDIRTIILAAIERISDKTLTVEQLKIEGFRAGLIFEGCKTAIARDALLLKAYDMFDGSFGKNKLPECFNEINNLIGEEKNEEKTTDRRPLLQFKGNRVSQEDCKGKKLQGNQHSL